MPQDCLHAEVEALACGLWACASAAHAAHRPDHPDLAEGRRRRAAALQEQQLQETQLKCGGSGGCL